MGRLRVYIPSKARCARLWIMILTNLPHDDGVGEVVLKEGEGFPLPDVEPVGEHDVEAE